MTTADQEMAAGTLAGCHKRDLTRCLHLREPTASPREQDVVCCVKVLVLILGDPHLLLMANSARWQKAHSRMRIKTKIHN